MDILVKGVVIRSVRYSDKAFIGRVFTDLYGLKSFMIPSGTGAKSSKAQFLQPLTPVEFKTFPKENVHIWRLKDLGFSQRFSDIPFHPMKAAIVLFMAELLNTTLIDDYRNERLLNFLFHALSLLDDEFQVRNFPIWFVVTLSGHYGFYPQDTVPQANVFDLKSGEFCRHTPDHSFFLDGETAAALRFFITHHYATVRDFSMSYPIRKELLDGMVNFLHIHLQKNKKIASLSVLQEVFHG